MPLDAPLGGGAGCRQEDGGAAGSLLDVLSLSQTSPSQAASKRELIVLLADALAGESLRIRPRRSGSIGSEGVSFDALGERMGISRKAAIDEVQWRKGANAVAHGIRPPWRKVPGKY